MSSSSGVRERPTPRTVRQRIKDDQKQFIDPQAPIGTEAKSSKKGQQEGQAGLTRSRPQLPSPTAHLTCKALSDHGRRPVDRSCRRCPPGSNAYHMIMGPDGKILLIAGSGNNSAVFEAGTFKSYIWEPRTAADSSANLEVPTDMFCAGHMLMSNGQGIAAGGTGTDYSPWKGSKALYTFDFEHRDLHEAGRHVGRPLVPDRGQYPRRLRLDRRRLRSKRRELGDLRGLEPVGTESMIRSRATVSSRCIRISS